MRVSNFDFTLTLTLSHKGRGNDEAMQRQERDYTRLIAAKSSYQPFHCHFNRKSGSTSLMNRSI